MSDGRKAAIFLDRDGTIIEDRGHLRSPGDVHFLPGSLAALQKLSDAFPLFLVTHQVGVARGFLSMNQVAEVNRYLTDALRGHGIELTDVYVCPHAREEGCICCKPSPWFLRRAAEEYGLDLSRSYMIGDHPHDVFTGTAAGATGIYVLTGHGLRHRSELGEGSRIVVPGIEDATRIVLAETEFSEDNHDSVEEAAFRLRRGGVVAFPTETVYGLGANAYDEAAAARIFAIKERPRFDPLIVHIPDMSWLSKLAGQVPDPARRLAEAFWPGPLTLVLPRLPIIPDLTVAGLDTVALRVPDHPLARQLLARTEVPLAAPSANRFSSISPTEAEHVQQGFEQGVDLILDGGPCRVGVESTIIGFQDDKPVLLRPGGIGLEEIERVIGEPVVREQRNEDAKSSPVAAPGMSRRHYSPKTPMRLFGGGETLPRPPPDKRAGLLVARPRAPEETTGFRLVETLSENGEMEEIARHLFSALRRLDQAGVDLIYAELGTESGLGRAINDRLRRAAADLE